MTQKPLDNKVFLLLGGLLICGSLLMPHINNHFNNVTDSNLVFAKPTNVQLLELCNPVIKSLDNSGNDGVNLAKLYNDLATLIEMNDVIKSTEEIREANRLSGHMLKLNIQDKYDGLEDAANNLIVKSIGDDNSLLSDELRQKSVEAFRALAWACNEGAK